MHRQLKGSESSVCARTITRRKKWNLKSQANGKESQGTDRVPRTFHLLTFQCSSLSGRPYFSPTESPIINAKMPSNTTTTTMIIINFWRGARETNTSHYYKRPKSNDNSSETQPPLTSTVKASYQFKENSLPLSLDTSVRIFYIC